MSTGRIIGGRYRLKERIGRGSYGVVWRAEELLGGQAVVEVAVKIFTADVNRSEIALLASLSHPNILGYRAVLEDDGDVCLVTELADGGDGAAALKAWPDGLPPNKVGEILVPISEALGHLHAQNWVHRDVKPANILFVRGVPKLGDVGTARALGNTGRATSTASLAYAAPELFSGRLGPGVDVYALGCTAYELLTSRIPFEGSPTELVHKHLNVEVEIPDDMPENLRQLIRGCMQKDLAKRWSLQQVRDAVLHPAPTPGQASESSSSRPPSVRMVERIGPDPAPKAPSPPPSVRMTERIGPDPAPPPSPQAAVPPKPFTPPPPVPPPQAPPPPAPPPQKPPTSATPLDPTLRRHLLQFNERWGEADVWRAFMQAAQAVAREHGMGERDLIRRAQQLLPEVQAEIKRQNLLGTQVAAWVHAQGTPRWSAPAWATFLDQVQVTDEVILARMRDTLVARLYPPAVGATRNLDFGRGVQHVLIYLPIAKVLKPTTQLMDTLIAGGKDPHALAGIWFSAKPVTVAEWFAVMGQAVTPGLDPNSTATGTRDAALPFLEAIGKRFPLEELRWPMLAEYGGIKTLRKKAAPAPVTPQQQRAALARRQAPKTLGGVLAQSLGKMAVETLTEIGEAWLSDQAASDAKKREMNLVSPVPGGKR